MKYKGYEIIKGLSDGIFEEGTCFTDNYNKYILKRYDDNELVLYKEDTVTNSLETPDYSYFSDKENTFEICYEPIDVEKIEKLNFKNEYTGEKIEKICIKINELIDAIKFLNKK